MLQLITNIKILSFAICGIIFTTHLFANNSQVIHIQNDKTSCALGYGLSNNLAKDGIILGDTLNVVYENLFQGELPPLETKPSFALNTYNKELKLLDRKQLSYKNQELATSAFKCFSSFFINNNFVTLMRLNENSKGIYLFDINKGITTKSFDVLEPQGLDFFNYMTYDTKDRNIIIAGIINNTIHIREYSLQGKTSDKRLNCNMPISAIYELDFADDCIISITKCADIRKESSIISIFNKNGSLRENTKYNGKVRYLGTVDDSMFFLQNEKTGRTTTYRIIRYEKENGYSTQRLGASGNYIINDYASLDIENRKIQIVKLGIDKLHILKYGLDAALIDKYEYNLPGLYFNINFVQEFENCIYIGINYLVKKREIKSTQMEFSILKINQRQK